MEMKTRTGMIMLSMFFCLGILHQSSASLGSSNLGTCVGSTMNKLMFNQSGYVQFVYFGGFVFPDLTSFHTCFWFNLVNSDRRATIVHYANEDTTRTNKLNIEWTGGAQPTWKMLINNVSVGAIKAQRIFSNSWHHACLSWDNKVGEYSAFQDGYLIGQVTNQESKNQVIKGRGGQFALGQNQEAIRLGGMDQGAGIEGFVTLFHFDSQPISSPKSSAALQTVRSLYRDCKAQDRGDIIGWLRTHRKGYGGVTEIFAKESCGQF